MLTALRHALAWGGHADVPAGAVAFSYHRGAQPVLWALLGASVLETAVLHLLLARLWSLEGSLVLLAVSLAGLLWLIGLIASLGRLPLLVTATEVRVRCGLLIDEAVPLDQIATASVVANPGDLKRPGLLKASLLAYPNVLIELAKPLSVRGRGRRSRAIMTIALRPDDGMAFAAAITEAKRRTLRV
jgi:hypothetical protein